MARVTMWNTSHQTKIFPSWFTLLYEVEVNSCRWFASVRTCPSLGAVPSSEGTHSYAFFPCGASGCAAPRPSLDNVWIGYSDCETGNPPEEWESELKLPAARPVDETCRRAQVVSLRSSRCRESSKCKEEISFYCSALANPAAPLKWDLRLATISYGECARWSIFNGFAGIGAGFFWVLEHLRFMIADWRLQIEAAWIPWIEVLSS
jgi:hypothetical protein